MEKDLIIFKLEAAHTELINWLEAQPAEHWVQGPEDKWTTGQHSLHLLQSLQPLNKALSVPKFLLRFKFGKANREVREFEAIYSRYKERLQGAQGRTFGPSQQMKIPSLAEKAKLIKELQTAQRLLQKKTLKWSDSQLDTLILPHPLMGKMPVREIIMWTVHHVNHHLNTLKEKY